MSYEIFAVGAAKDGVNDALRVARFFGVSTRQLRQYVRRFHRANASKGMQ